MRLLITGTGSDVGKTVVGCALARSLRCSGKHVVAVKPVETGCIGAPGDQEDGVLLAKATGQSQPSHAIFRLSEQVAPPLASDRSGIIIDFDALVLKIERYGGEAEYLLIEGLGGLLSPVTWEWNMVDVARTVGASALVVAVDRKDAINQTLLILSALELAGIPCAGVMLTSPEAPDQSTGLNAAAIARLSGLDRVASLPGTISEQSAAMRTLEEWLSRVPATA
ncbi:MAG TPA: dethiobiotin synthase [Gemmatimonadales bacterium]|nr:dethiobiotin synthase [Gemmatimonadales bacterium]